MVGSGVREFEVCGLSRIGPDGMSGQALAFTTGDRPLGSRRGWSAAPLRHGVSRVRSGFRHTLGLVFHDAA